MTDSSFTVHTLPVGYLATNCYLLVENSSRKTLVIDPGAEASRIIEAIRSERLMPQGIVNTHGHADHIGANRELKQEFDVPLYIHRLDAPFLSNPVLNGSALFATALQSPAADVLLEDGMEIALGSLSCHVMHTPGHTPGGMCLRCGGVLFTGDTLFCGTAGRTDLAGGDDDLLMRSLGALSVLPPELTIYPGHENACTLAAELRHNPYLRR